MPNLDKLPPFPLPPRPAGDASAAALQPHLDVRPGSLRAWLFALRPRSLLVAISPVLAAVALAWNRSGHFAAGVLLLALCAAVLMQAITNLQNDAGYTARGAERRATRTGLPRATANGWLTVREVRAMIAACIAVAIALALPLAFERGWPVVAMGLASIAAALAYMAGPRPIAYTPLGELFVFVFFGLVATAGTDYVATGELPPAATWLVAAALGLLAASALLVNNSRDTAHDAAVGRRTFPVVFGPGVAHGVYAAALLLPYPLVAAAAWLQQTPGMLLTLLLAPEALRLRRAFAEAATGAQFNGVLFRTFRMELAWTALLVAGVVADRALR